MTARTERFELMDGLRAIAALAVLGTHAADPAHALGFGTLSGHLAQRLDVGVTVFFLISAFLLYRPFARARILGEDPPASGPYAWRRFLRIIPAYWIALCLSALWLGKDEVFTATGLPTYFGLGQTYREATFGGGLVQAWSLCVELAFYAFLPLFAWAMRRLRGDDAAARARQELWVLGGLAALSLAYKAVVLAAGSATQVRISPALVALPAYLDHFAVGMALAVVSVRLDAGAAGAAARAPRPLALLRRAPSLAWAVALVAFVVVSTQIGIGDRPFEAFTPAQYVGRHLLYAVIALALMLPAVFCTRGQRGLATRVLAHPAMAFLGLISYGIFLWNPTVIALLTRWGVHPDAHLHPYFAWPAATLIGAGLLATVSFYAIERPALRLARRTGAVAGGSDRTGDVLPEPAP
jgi:peptidoglycan/LPS O-acetylase OafA/YrhL